MCQLRSFADLLQEMSDGIEKAGNLLAVNGRTRIATLIEEAPSEAAIAGSKNTYLTQSQSPGSDPQEITRITRRWDQTSGTAPEGKEIQKLLIYALRRAKCDDLGVDIPLLGFSPLGVCRRCLSNHALLVALTLEIH